MTERCCSDCTPATFLLCLSAPGFPQGPKTKHTPQPVEGSWMSHGNLTYSCRPPHVHTFTLINILETPAPSPFTVRSSTSTFFLLINYGVSERIRFAYPSMTKQNIADVPKILQQLLQNRISSWWHNDNRKRRAIFSQAAVERSKLQRKQWGSPVLLGHHPTPNLALQKDIQNQIRQQCTGIPSPIPEFVYKGSISMFSLCL